LQQFEHSEVIGIGDSGPLGDLIWHRLAQENITIETNIAVQTYFIAARLVAQNIGVCVVDQYTAQGNANDKVAIATITPALNFNLSALQLADKKLSQLANDFLTLIIELSTKNQPPIT